MKMNLGSWASIRQHLIGAAYSRTVRVGLISIVSGVSVFLTRNSYPYISAGTLAFFLVAGGVLTIILRFDTQTCLCEKPEVQQFLAESHHDPS